MKMEIELTDEQAEKVKILKENDIEIGDAIDILFEMKDAVKQQGDFIIDTKISQANKQKAELEAKLSEIDEELSLFEKLKDTALDVGEKQKIVENEYGKINKTFDESVQNAKHDFKWSKSIFKF